MDSASTSTYSEHSATLEQGSISLIESLRYEWEALVSSLPKTEPFIRNDWFASYASAFSRDSSVALLISREGRTLRGITPLIRQNTCFQIIPARTLRSLSGKHSCRFDCVYSTDHRSTVMKATWQALKSDTSWDAIEALDVPFDGTLHELASLANTDGYPVATWPTLHSPYLTIPTDGSDPFTHCPPQYRKTRKRIYNALRKLETHGQTAFEVATQNYKNALQSFITLESAGWKGKNRSAIACSPQITEFYHQVCKRLARTDSLRIYTLLHKQRPIAVELGLVDSNVYFSPKATYDEQYSSFSPGHILTRHIITDLAQQGIHRYDFLGPRARHKTIWAGEVRSHAHVFIFRPTITGWARYFFIKNLAARMRSLKRRLFSDPQA